MASASLQFDARDRVLVFAPHPDDETIAAGALIQCALAAGAKLRVVFVTDGDNNPWPQRWLERRWHIGSAERARWGARRRREALAALAMLGVDETSAHFLGWPDQGLTARLMQDDSAEAILAAEIAGFAPSHVVLPTLTDGHPDHSALRVMLELALLRSRQSCERLAYVLHGPLPENAPENVSENAPGNAIVSLPSDPSRQARKRAALQAYTTQISLSRGRLSRLSDRPEVFGTGTAADTHRSGDAGDLELRLPLPPLPGRCRRHALLLVLANADSVRPDSIQPDSTRPDSVKRVRIALPPVRLMRRGIDIDSVQGVRVRLEIVADTLRVTISGAATTLLRSGYVKLERAWPRLVIFDAAGWHDIDECRVREHDLATGRDERLAVRALT